MAVSSTDAVSDVKGVKEGEEKPPQPFQQTLLVKLRQSLSIQRSRSPFKEGLMFTWTNGILTSSTDSLCSITGETASKDFLIYIISQENN